MFNNATMNSKNETNVSLGKHTHLDDESKRTIGAVFVVLMVLGLVSNAAVLFTFKSTPRLRTHMNVFIMGCVGGDLVMVILGYPFIIIACFRGFWDFSEAMCKWYGFMMTVLSVANMTILAAIATDRFIVIMRFRFAKRTTPFKCVIILVLCYAYGLCWATLPLVGWGKYAVEPNLLTCGPDWINQDSSVKSYNYAMTTMIVGFSGTVIFLSYVGILLKVRKHNSNNVTVQLTMARLREIRVAFSAFLMMVGFSASWLPYTILGLWSMANDVSNLSPTAAILPPLFAKSSCVWNPLFYALKNEELRAALIDIVKRCFRQNSVAPSELPQPIPSPPHQQTLKVITARV